MPTRLKNRIWFQNGWGPLGLSEQGLCSRKLKEGLKLPVFYITKFQTFISISSDGSDWWKACKASYTPSKQLWYHRERKALQKLKLLANASRERERGVVAPWSYFCINSKCTCISHNVVYVIKCRTCNKIYIGQTGRRLGDRFRDHLRSTWQTNTDLPVGRHLATPLHMLICWCP